MDPNQDQQSQDSSVIGRLNSLAGKRRSLQRATYGAYKKLRLLGAGMESMGAAGPVGVGIAVITILTVLIIFSGAAPVPVVGGNPTDSSSPSASFSPGPMPTPGASVDPSSAVAKLKSDFNITIIGGAPQQIASVYNYLSIYLSYPMFTSRIKSASPTITITTTQPGGADAFTNTSGDVTIFTNFWTRGDYTQKKYLIHEFAHTMGNTGQEQLQRDLYTQVHDAGKDSSCFASYGIIKTYTPTNSSPNVIHETFAESVADTIMCDSGTCGGSGKGGGAPIQNFPQTCLNTYNYIRANVLK